MFYTYFEYMSSTSLNVTYNIYIEVMRTHLWYMPRTCIVITNTLLSNLSATLNNAYFMLKSII